ncbi:hypothetical protein HN747_04395 [archaeon]|jgi:hypothetical protein|nr:hypothetical protein [archaeon]
MEHGKVEVGYDRINKRRNLIYTSPSEEQYKGTFTGKNNNSFEVERVGNRSSGTITTTSSRRHVCGANGFGGDLDDTCAGCEEMSTLSGIIEDISYLMGEQH